MTRIAHNSGVTSSSKASMPDRNTTAIKKRRQQHQRDVLPTLGWASRFALFLIAIGFAAQANSQAGKADFLLFASGEYTQRGGVSNIALKNSEFTPTADLLYSYGNGPWRILGEYYLTDDESELERLQFGFDTSADTTIWLGRFHRPNSVWNGKFHHGAYLQPSITRPAVENWEDESGVVPTHSTGVMIESGIRRPKGDGFRYTASVGIGPSIGDEGLQPFDLLSNDNSENGVAAAVAFSYYPDFVGSPNFGVVAGYSDITVKPSLSIGTVVPFNIEQLVIGAQIDWQWDPWQLIAAAYYIDGQPDAGFSQFGGSFTSAYAQILRQLGSSSQLYVRLEGGNNTRTAGYLQLFPMFIAERVELGGRYDFAAHQAIALEISAAETAQNSFTEFRIQWSGVFQ